MSIHCNIRAKIPHFLTDIVLKNGQEVLSVFIDCIELHLVRLVWVYDHNRIVEKVMSLERSASSFLHSSLHYLFAIKYWTAGSQD